MPFSIRTFSAWVFLSYLDVRQGLRAEAKDLVKGGGMRSVTKEKKKH